MSDKKFFNAWVSKNFKGLSAHTLTQFPESGLISVKSANGGLIRQY